MNLLRWFTLVLTLGAALGCHDTVAPIPSTYALVTIGGRELPTFYSPIPEAPTIISGSLLFNGKGVATLRQQQRDINGNQTSSFTLYRYAIKNGVIEFDYYPSCPPFALCIRLPKGTLINDHALIDFFGDGSVIFDYRLEGQI